MFLAKKDSQDIYLIFFFLFSVAHGSANDAADDEQSSANGADVEKQSTSGGKPASGRNGRHGQFAESIIASSKYLLFVFI